MTTFTDALLRDAGEHLTTLAAARCDDDTAATVRQTVESLIEMLTDMTITAIWATAQGCRCAKFRDDREEYHAAISHPAHTRERYIIIDEAAWHALRARAADDDYRDGDYIGFNRPIAWSDVFTDERGL